MRYVAFIFFHNSPPFCCNSDSSVSTLNSNLTYLQGAFKIAEEQVTISSSSGDFQLPPTYNNKIVFNICAYNWNAWFSAPIKLSNGGWAIYGFENGGTTRIPKNTVLSVRVIYFDLV